MDSILSKQHYRKTFFLIVLFILIIALLIRYFAIPYFEPAQKLTPLTLFGSFLDNLVVSLFITVSLGAFIFWLTPGIVKRSAIEVVDPKQINPLLKSAITETQSWFFKGACGRFTRCTTIPMLADAARTKGIGRDITIFVLNPNNDELCAAYATYRRSLKSGATGVPWTREVVQEEILATAITALRFQFSEPLLRIRLFFVDNFSVFRFDISDQYAMITKEDKGASALRADAGTYFYESYKDDLRLTERQAKEIKCCGKLEFHTKIDDAKLREAIICSGIFEDKKLAKLNIQRLLNCINSPSNPY